MPDYAVTRIRWSDPDPGSDGKIVEVEEGETVKAGTFPDDVVEQLRAAGAISSVPTGTEADLGLIVASKDAEIEALRAHIAALEEARDAPEPEAPEEPDEPTEDEKIGALKEQLGALENLADKGEETPDVEAKTTTPGAPESVTAAKAATKK